MSNDEPIHLLLDPSLKVAGQVLEGAVDLYWPGIREKNIEEVVLKLRGKLQTKFDRYANNAEGERTNHSEHQYVNLIHQDMTLWHQSSGVVPPPDSPILRLPFRLTLPDELPPSCDIGTFSKKGSIGYYLEAVGKRSGLHFDKKSTVVFPLLPSLSSGAQLREALQQGWRGPWKAIEQEKQIRRGIWGEYSHVKMIFGLPDLEVLPLFAPIPFTLQIITVSKHMHLDDTPKDGEPIFPAPPTKAGELELKLERNMFLRAWTHSESAINSFVAYLGGLGPDLSIEEYGRVQIQMAEKVWIPEKKDKGAWKQEATVKSWFQLNCPPTFDASTMSINYHMRLKVDFPGMGNDLKADIPVRVASSMYAPRHMGWNGAAPQMDLPPEYFQASNWHKS